MKPVEIIKVCLETKLDVAWLRHVTSVVFFCLMVVFLSGCLESEERPKLDPKDLVQFLGIEGIYRLDPVGKSEPPKAQYISIEARANKEYQLTIRNVSETGTLEQDPTRFSAVFIPLPPDAGKASRFLGVLTDDRVIPAKTYFGTLKQEGAQFEFGWVRLNHESKEAVAARRVLANHGIAWESSKLKGRLTSTGLRTIFSDPKFMGAVNDASEYHIVSLPKEEAAKWSRMFDVNHADDQIMAFQDFLVEMFNASMVNVIDILAAAQPAKSQEAKKKLAEFVKMAENVASWRENYQGKDWWQAIDARYRLQDMKMLLAAKGEDRLAYVQAQEALSKGNPLRHLGKYREALRQLEGACQTFFRLLDQVHPSSAECLRLQGLNYEALGEYDRAGPLFRRAVEINEKAVGVQHPAYGMAIIQRGMLAESLGREEEASYDYDLGGRAIVLSLFSGQSDAAVLLHGGRYLTALLKVMSYKAKHDDYDKSVSMLQGMVEEFEKGLPELKEYLAKSKPQLPIDENAPAGAQQMAVRIEEFVDSRSGGALMVWYATLMETLADLYTRRGHYGEAELLYQKAREVWKSEFGERHLGHAACLGKLGSLHALMGRYQEAEANIRDALALMRSTLGTNHVVYAAALKDLGKMLVKNQRESEAASLFLESAQAQWRYLVQNFPAMSDGQKRLFLDRNQFDQTDLLASLALRKSADHVGSALDSLLMSKQLLFEAARKEGGALRAALESASPEWLSLWQEREKRRREVASLALQASGQSGPSITGSQASRITIRLQKLTEEIEGLEQSLRQGNPSYAREARLGVVSKQDVKAGLRTDEGHLEYIRYRPYDFAEDTWQESRYGLLLMQGSNDRVVAVDLGEASAIDAAVTKIQQEGREFLAYVKQFNFPETDAAPKKVRDAEHRLAEASASLGRLIWQPIEGQLNGVKRLYVAPDGQLSLIPFEILTSKGKKGEWRYLVEDLELVYLNTGRDLARLALTVKSAPAKDSVSPDKPSAVLIGNPTFSATPRDVAHVVAGLPVVSAPAAKSESAPGGSTLGGAMPATRRLRVPRDWDDKPQLGHMLKSAKGQLDKAKYAVETFEGLQAVEEHVLHVTSPTILQLATHGYLLDQAQKSDNGWDNPLLRSMLLYAGVNQAKPEQRVFYKVGKDLLNETEAQQGGLSANDLQKARVDIGDGILTAYEVTGMNLQGTELVNLTACETGLGEVTPDGVIGLRHAFLLAGARALTTSMWEVPVDATTEQIAAFYGRWLGGGKNKKAKSRYAAFHETQLNALAKVRAGHYQAGHPFFWAGVIYIGDPGDLPVVPEPSELSQPVAPTTSKPAQPAAKN